MTYRFYDPHPGLLGCPTRLPEKFRLVANELDGKVMTPEEAIAAFGAIMGREFTVTFANGCLMLRWCPEGRDFPVDVWRLLRAEPWAASEDGGATMNWISVNDRLPDQGRIVATKIDDGRRVRNETNLKLVGRLWFFTDGSMYVYYEPTHWAEIASPAERRVP